MKTEQQLKNLREALVWWQTVPEANVASELCYWRDCKSQSYGVDCGTTACFGGWCAVYPALVAQGVRPNHCGAPSMPYVYRASEVAAKLFGDESLFGARNECQADAGFIGTDHALVTNRIRWALEQA